jgi:formate hydrogenlyase transcriptional activator
LLVEGVRDYAIFMLDSQGRVKSWNPEAERIKGYTAEEILGQHFSRFYTEEDIERGKPDHELGIAAAQGRFEDEGWRVRKDGSRFFANVIVTALRDENGQLHGFSKVTRDFTERKRAEEALLLEITNVLVSSLDIRQHLSAISMSIRKINAYDYASLALHDPETNGFRVQLLDPLEDRNAESNECLLPTEDSPAVRAFESREPVVTQSPRDW